MSLAESENLRLDLLARPPNPFLSPSPIVGDVKVAPPPSTAQPGAIQVGQFSEITGKYLERRLYRNELANWLSTIRWDIFGTITFRRSCGAAGALRAFNTFCREFGIVRGFGAWETGTQSGRTRLPDVHLHLLLSGWSDFRCGVPEKPQNRKHLSSVMWEIAFERWGFCKFEPFRQGEKAAEYCVKYVFKKEDTDFFVWGNGKTWGMVKKTVRNTKKNY